MREIVLMLLLLIICVSGCLDNDAVDAYNRGYDDGSHGNDTSYQTCRNYHNMYWRDHPISSPIICSTGGHTDDIKMEYCRGYMHGYNVMMDDKQRDEVESNLSSIING